MENWTFDWSNTFKKLYKNKDNSVKPKVDEKLKELATSDPFKFGKRKKGLKYSNNAYAVKVDKSNRIVYEPLIQDGQKIIRLLKVCDHKTVYGRD
ncbi:MAG: hypothetical protein AMDU2_EPLC00013G0010 [Thermoplasmatales archaeon E-plasma]|nr:MAG: hypothetical protein AMDU2_EPLC00013G0010 [Thermoplasmatales archaeon E-plasma]